jgi:fructokinase
VFNVVGLGEVLWDVFPDRQILGGAPANFAHHAAQLGQQAYVVSRVGDDQLGRDVLAALAANRLSSDYIQVDPVYPTGTVQVEVGADGNPDFKIAQDVAWDHLEPSEALDELASRTDAVCFGSLAQRDGASRLAVGRFLDSAVRALKVFDINLRQHFWSVEVIRESLARAQVLKLNAEEQVCLADLFPGPREPLRWAQDMINRHKLRLVCMTRGAEGCLLVSADEHAECPGVKVDVVDTVGAGDAFAAALVSGYLANQPLPAIGDFANRVGAYVASQPGGTPALPEDLCKTS